MSTNLPSQIDQNLGKVIEAIALPAATEVGLILQNKEFYSNLPEYERAVYSKGQASITALGEAFITICLP